MTVQEFLFRLDGVREVKGCWKAKCPAHDDKRPSLSVAEGEDGRILLKCFAGCEPEAIVKALGLTVCDLFPNPPGCTQEEYAAAKGLPLDFLRSLGLSQISYSQGEPAVRIPYRDTEGVEKAVQFRIALDGENRFRWKSGSKPILYGLWRLDRAKAEGYVVIVEGASDCHTLWLHDLPAIGLPSATGWREGWADYFEGIGWIYVVIEPDRGGQALKKWLARSGIRDRTFLVTLDGVKDVSALYLRDRALFRGRLQAALDVAVPWPQVEESAAKAEADESWRACEVLAKAPVILDEFARDLRRHGIAGEKRFAKLLYLATISRFLERPVSVAAKGPSAAGKSIVLSKTLEFFPSRAYYALSGMSERALVYSQEPLQNRMLVLYEAQGLQGDWASYLVRSLLSEGRVRYETVMKTERGPEAMLIEREGPTGLLVTTTKILLHPENETRLLSVAVDDSPAQTRNVLREIAKDGERGGVNFARWHALQTWLQGSEHRVVVPYAEALAEMVPPVAVRLRRDFGTLLALVRAHATLHQATRDRDAEGRIIATLTDYAVVRDLVADLMAQGVEASVSATVRETVEAVKRLTEAPGSLATVKQVAKELGIDSPPALRRVRMAIEKGYLKNEETRKGRPAQLVLGDPLPDDMAILPKMDDPRLADFTVSGETRGMEKAPFPRLARNGNGDGRAVNVQKEDMPEWALPGVAGDGLDDIAWGLPT